MLFYFVRHGQTHANFRRIIAGSGLDQELNDEGHRQAQALASVISEKLTEPVHRVVASGLKRAQQTGNHLARALALPLETAHDLREWDLGEWEGQDYDVCVPLMLGGGEPQRGEPRRDFYSRVAKGWKSLHHEKNAYLIVSHGGVWMALQDFLQIPRFKIGNCQMVRVARFANIWRAEIVA